MSRSIEHTPLCAAAEAVGALVIADPGFETEIVFSESQLEEFTRAVSDVVEEELARRVADALKPAAAP